MADDQESLSDGDDDLEGDIESGESQAETNNNHDPTVPQVELALYQLNVTVSGQATDELDDVEATAIRLMDYLIKQSTALEDRPDGRGLG